MAHYLNPSRETAHVVLFYRDFKDYGSGGGDYGDGGEYGGGSESAPNGFKSHRGLGVNAYLTARVLRKHSIRCDVAACADITTVRKTLESTPDCTHAVIQALWIDAADQLQLCRDFPRVHFVVRVHSQIGFLVVEPPAIKILRDLLIGQETVLNLTVTANSERLVRVLESAYATKVLHLPNLYEMERVEPKRDEDHGHRTLRIGSFGAHRLLKNHTTAAAAALMIAKRRGSDLEFWINSGREEHAGKKNGVYDALRFMFEGLRWAKLVEAPWAEWPQFRQTIGHMDLCLQVSFTETFNIVTADGVCEGVPSVVSKAIEWAPKQWMADVDDAEDIARVGSYLLSDKHGAREGWKHLEHAQKHAIHAWLTYLDANPTI